MRKSKRKVTDLGTQPDLLSYLSLCLSNFARIHDEAFASGYSCGTGVEYSIDAGADGYGNYAGQDYSEEGCEEGTGRDAVAAGTS